MLKKLCLISPLAFLSGCIPEPTSTEQQYEEHREWDKEQGIVKKWSASNKFEWNLSKPKDEK